MAFNGSNISERMETSANGGRVRFTRDIANIVMDLNDVETIGVNALGGDANDFVDGQQGNDVAFLGAGRDTFQWDPGDGNDTIEGQADRDTMVFNGSNIGENIEVAANGGRVRFFRNVAAVTMDLNDVEVADFNAFGGADNVVVNDLSGTDLTAVDSDLAAQGGGDDAQPDNVIVSGTNGDDVVTVAGGAGSAQASGLAAAVTLSGAAGSDRLTVNTLAGDDVVDGSSLAADSVLLTADGGADDDVLLGGAGSDTLLGGAGDDVLLGGPGNDTIDGGTGDNVVIQSLAVANAWLKAHADVAELVR